MTSIYSFAVCVCETKTSMITSSIRFCYMLLCSFDVSGAGGTSALIYFQIRQQMLQIQRFWPFSLSNAAFSSQLVYIMEMIHISRYSFFPSFILLNGLIAFSRVWLFHDCCFSLFSESCWFLAFKLYKKLESFLNAQNFVQIVQLHLDWETFWKSVVFESNADIGKTLAFF